MSGPSALSSVDLDRPCVESVELLFRRYLYEKNFILLKILLAEDEITEFVGAGTSSSNMQHSMQHSMTMSSSIIDDRHNYGGYYLNNSKSRPPPFIRLISKFDYITSILSDVESHYASLSAPSFGAGSSRDTIWFEIEEPVDTNLDEFQDLKTVHNLNYTVGQQMPFSTRAILETERWPFGVIFDKLLSTKSNVVRKTLPPVLVLSVHFRGRSDQSVPKGYVNSPVDYHSPGSPKGPGASSVLNQNVINSSSMIQMMKSKSQVSDNITSFLSDFRQAIFLAQNNANAFMRFPMVSQKKMIDTLFGNHASDSTSQDRPPKIHLSVAIDRCASYWQSFEAMGYPKKWKSFGRIPIRFHFPDLLEHNFASYSEYSDQPINTTLLTCSEVFMDSTAPGGIKSAQFSKGQIKNVDKNLIPVTLLECLREYCPFLLRKRNSLNLSANDENTVGDNHNDDYKSVTRVEEEEDSDDANAEPDVENVEKDYENPARNMTKDKTRLMQDESLKADGWVAADSNEKHLISLSENEVEVENLWDWDCICLGITLPLNVPLWWLWLHFSYWDQVLHIVVRGKRIS